MTTHKIRLTVNGKALSTHVAPDKPLLWVLREDLGLTGTKYSCGEGHCGSCTVHVDRQPVFSCLIPVEAVADKNITTIEGLSDDRSHPVQRAWIEEQVSQCGYCQSGQIMWAAAFLAENGSPSRQQIVEAMKPILCRCGTYLRIVRAIEKAAKEMGITKRRTHTTL
jgi:isoquinoline 1-oxidoreductase alpha subunit